jgi:hypothetical protein
MDIRARALDLKARAMPNILLGNFSFTPCTSTVSIHKGCIFVRQHLKYALADAHTRRSPPRAQPWRRSPAPRPRRSSRRALLRDRRW